MADSGYCKCGPGWRHEKKGDRRNHCEGRSGEKRTLHKRQCTNNCHWMVGYLGSVTTHGITEIAQEED